jgi:hypothetical protein
MKLRFYGTNTYKSLSEELVCFRSPMFICEDHFLDDEEGNP